MERGRLLWRARAREVKRGNCSILLQESWLLKRSDYKGCTSSPRDGKWGKGSTGRERRSRGREKKFPLWKKEGEGTATKRTRGILGKKEQDWKGVGRYVSPGRS